MTIIKNTIKANQEENNILIFRERDRAIKRTQSPIVRGLLARIIVKEIEIEREVRINNNI